MQLTETEDRRLAERAAAGDDDAFTELVDRHREALVRFVARRTGRSTIAEDAVQEALLSAHRALRHGAPPRDMKAWLHTIAWRRAVDMLRREAPAAHADEWEDVQTVEGLDVLVADAWEFEHMLRLWAGLPHRQRHALAMSVLEGRSLEEIGDAFGVSVEAAKSLVARSRRSLAHAVAADDVCEVEVGRRRHLLLFPSWLIERTRDAATFATHHEQPASLITKACAGACAAVIGSSGTAAVVAVVPPDPRIIAVVQRAESKPKPERVRTPPAPALAPVATATPTPVVTATAPRSHPASERPRPPKPSFQKTLERRRSLALQRKRQMAGRPPGYPHDDPGPYTPTAGGGSTDAKATPTPSPTPSPAPTTEPTPQPTPDPAG